MYIEFPVCLQIGLKKRTEPLPIEMDGDDRPNTELDVSGKGIPAKIQTDCPKLQTTCEQKCIHPENFDEGKTLILIQNLQQGLSS